MIWIILFIEATPVESKLMSVLAAQNPFLLISQNGLGKVGLKFF